MWRRRTAGAQSRIVGFVVRSLSGPFRPERFRERRSQRLPTDQVEQPPVARKCFWFSNRCTTAHRQNCSVRQKGLAGALRRAPSGPAQKANLLFGLVWNRAGGARRRDEHL